MEDGKDFWIVKDEFTGETLYFETHDDVLLYLQNHMEHIEQGDLITIYHTAFTKGEVPGPVEIN